LCLGLHKTNPRVQVQSRDSPPPAPFAFLILQLRSIVPAAAAELTPPGCLYFFIFFFFFLRVPYARDNILSSLKQVQNQRIRRHPRPGIAPGPGPGRTPAAAGGCPGTAGRATETDKYLFLSFLFFLFFFLTPFATFCPQLRDNVSRKPRRAVVREDLP